MPPLAAVFPIFTIGNVNWIHRISSMACNWKDAVTPLASVFGVNHIRHGLVRKIAFVNSSTSFLPSATEKNDDAS